MTGPVRYWMVLAPESTLWLKGKRQNYIVQYLCFTSINTTRQSSNFKRIDIVVSSHMVLTPIRRCVFSITDITVIIQKFYSKLYIAKTYDGTQISLLPQKKGISSGRSRRIKLLSSTRKSIGIITKTEDESGCKPNEIKAYLKNHALNSIIRQDFPQYDKYTFIQKINQAISNVSNFTSDFQFLITKYPNQKWQDKIRECHEKISLYKENIEATLLAVFKRFRYMRPPISELLLMDKVYDLLQHTHVVIFHLGMNKTHLGYCSTSTRDVQSSILRIIEASYITYDKNKSNALSWGYDSVDDNEEDTVQIDVSREKLYQLFEKGKNSWDQDDIFTLTAVSDFIRLFVEKLIKDSEEIKDSGALHYILVVPSEWEEEIREVLIRPIFVQANLISKDDHQDRLLFCSDIESLCYFLSNPENGYFTKMTRNTILGRIVAVEENQVSIKLDLILIGNPLFDFSGSVTRPKIMNSNAVSLTSDDVKNGIREFIKIKFSFDAQERTILKIMKELGNRTFTYNMQDKEEASYLMKPFVTDRNIYKQDKHQKELIKSIRPFDICAEISKHLSNNLEQLLPNNLVKEYSLLKFTDEYTSEIELDEGLLQWSRFMFEYNRISVSSSYIVPKSPSNKYIGNQDIMYGACRYSISAIQNSNINSKPRILSTEDSAISSSVFLNSKPDAIMNIDILLDSTVLSFSLLDENGLIKEIWDHDYFVPDISISLRSLGSFFTFSEVITLNVKNSFITFVEDYLIDESKISSGELNKDMLIEIENILNVESHNKDIMVPIQQQIYIKAFILIYMTYINVIVSRKTPKIAGGNENIKTGYAITIEKALLQRLLVTEDELRDMIYTSNLVQENDSYKKLRITTQGEGLLPVIQQSFKLQFPLKSFFVVAQLHEDYVQLTLNQVVTESGSDHEVQETIVIQEEIIPIPNIYDSLCFNMWSNITEDSSLIQLCDTHKGYNNNELLDMFSLENQAEFTNNLKEYISKEILNKNLTTQKADKITVYLSNSCNCRVCLTVNDITEISFRPVLQDIISLVFTSLINKQLFGNYRNIQYVFHLICFNYNPQFQHILMRILDDEVDYFLYEQRIDMAYYTIPKLSNRLIQPILQQEPCSYKGFKAGVLRQVYSENFGFGFENSSDDPPVVLKSNREDTNTILIDDKKVFPLFKKGDKMNESQLNQVFYLNMIQKEEYVIPSLHFFKLKPVASLRSGEPIGLEHTTEKFGKSLYVNNINTFKTSQDAPYMISIVYHAYSSSLCFEFKAVGDEIDAVRITVMAEPMTLCRF
ncbi:hypothetical protein BDF21DRAFT_454688 [Thamnidium elegans]|nr:hypothetical protein BDF21DRAFT_454688 [Thamnidium elegans]